MTTPHQPPVPQSTDNMADFADDFKALTLSGMQPRPDSGGKLGTPIKVKANVYGLQVEKGVLIHHYDVRILAVETPRPGAAPRQRTGAAAASQERGLPVKLCRNIWDAFGAQHPRLAAVMAKTAYDGRKSAFTPVPFDLGNADEVFSVTLAPHDDSPNARSREFQVKLAHANNIDMSVLSQWIARTREGPTLADEVATAIQALDVLLRHDPIRRVGVISGGQGTKFFAGSSGTGIGLGAEVLSGFFQSVRPTAGGMVVNLDTAYSPFLRSGMTLDKVALQILNRGAAPAARGGGAPRGGRGGRGGARGGYQGPQGHAGASSAPFTDAEIKHLKWILRGAKVRVTHRVTSKEYVVVGFGESAHTHTFLLETGSRGAPATAVQRAQAAAAGHTLPPDAPAPSKRVSVMEYFKTKYNKTLALPSLQVVEVRGHEFIPMECLELLPGTGIPPTRLDRDQAAAMIKVAAKRPEERQRLIDVERSSIGYESNQRVAAWGLQASPEMKTVNARVLAPPKVIYSPQGRVKEPSVGRGQWNLLGTKFAVANKPLERWGVLSFADQRQMPQDRLQYLISQLVAQMQDRGMSVKNATPDLAWGSANTRLESIKALARAIVTGARNPRHEPPQLMIVILTDPKMYDYVKRDITMGLPVPIASQCLLFKNLMKDERSLGQYFGNVCMKLNAKLFGTNWLVDPRDLPKMTSKTIMLGADVTHPLAARGGEAVAPSVAALVATSDGAGKNYATQVRSQEGRQEIISELKDMAIPLILNWQQSNNKALPENMLFFRDGVSEGQYAAVVENEITALKSACREINPTYSPRITYIVCAKRHKIRFFATSDNQRDRSGNLPAGTVVDTDVTHPYIWDFYLQAHAGLVGTCRPTHYICLLDENGFTSDTMQRLINSLSYSFARATRSVSLVPVAYYADIVCTKARSYVYMDDSASSVASGHTGSITNTKAIQELLERTHPSSQGHKFPGAWFM